MVRQFTCRHRLSLCNVISFTANTYTMDWLENPQRCDPVRQTGLTLLKKMLNTLY